MPWFPPPPPAGIALIGALLLLGLCFIMIIELSGVQFGLKSYA